MEESEGHQRWSSRQDFTMGNDAAKWTGTIFQRIKKSSELLKTPQEIRIILKDTRENEFYLDYCNEAFLTLRLNAIGCKNVIKALDVRSSTGLRLQRLIDSGNSGIVTTTGI